jgi:pimeloyl-ACP methyl ester carboxylesterase
MNRRRLPKPALFALTALLAAAAGLPAAAPRTLSVTPHTFTAQDGTVVEAEYGRLEVPMRRGVEGSGTGTVELAFVRFPSTAAEPGSPIVYLAGGPGGSGIQAAAGSRFPLFQALRAVADVIAFDQRGTGDSKPSLACSEEFMLPLDRPASAEVGAAVLAEAAGRCAERLSAEGIELAGFNTLESAADLEALRLALGVEKLTLWGISYGTHLALATLEQYPRSIERLILAGVEPLHHSLKLPSDQEALLREIARRARAVPPIADRVPDLVAAIEKLVARLEAEPVTVTLTDPRSGQAFPVVLGGFDLRFVLANMLGSPQAFAPLPDFVARLGDGDWTALGLAAALGRFGRAPNGMSTAMDCASGASADWLERIEREARETVLGDAINFPFPGICRGIGVPDLGERFRAPVRSPAATLLISGTLDGRTPPSNAESIRPGLPNSVHLVLEGAGHSDPLFLSSPKILETMLAFLRGERLDDQRLAVPVPAFLAPRRVATVAAETLAGYAGNYRIADGDFRRAVVAGDVIYTVRGGGQPLPLRPMSETRFFYEGSATWLDFELDAAGAPVAMVVHHEGAEEGERATKVE